MNKIGKLDVVDTRSFLVPPGDGIWIEIDILDWKTKLNIKFEPEADEVAIRIEPQEDHGRITFKKWTQGLGMATSEPGQVALHSSGRKIYFMATLYLIGATPSIATGKFDIQFLIGTKE